MVVSEKLRRLGKVAAIAGFGLLVFLVVLYLSLPYGRFKDYMASQVSTYGYDMEAKHAGPSLGIGMTLKDVSLVSRPSGAGKPTRILINKAKLGVSLLSYLIGNKAISVSAEVFGGDIDADVKIGKNEASVDSSLSDIDLSELPWVKNLINLPTSGKLDVKLNLVMPKQRMSESKGSLHWECTACALGDGKAKLIIAGNPLLAEGLGLPKIRLGDFAGKIVIDKGVGRLQNVQFKSQDLEATVEGEIHLAQPMESSRVDIYVRFKLSDSLLRSSEKLRTIMDFTAQMGKRPDGFIGLRMSGTFQNMSNVQWLKTSPFVNTVTPPPPAPVTPPPPAPVPPPVPQEIVQVPPPAPAPAPAPPPPTPPPVVAPAPPVPPAALPTSPPPPAAVPTSLPAPSTAAMGAPPAPPAPPAGTAPGTTPPPSPPGSPVPPTQPGTSLPGASAEPPR